MMDAPLPAGLVPAWEQFFQEPHEPGADLYDEIFDSPILFPLQRKREMAAMMRAAGSPQVVMQNSGKLTTGTAGKSETPRGASQFIIRKIRRFGKSYPTGNPCGNPRSLFSV